MTQPSPLFRVALALAFFTTPACVDRSETHVHYSLPSGSGDEDPDDASERDAEEDAGLDYDHFDETVSVVNDATDDEPEPVEDLLSGTYYGAIELSVEIGGMDDATDSVTDDCVGELELEVDLEDPTQVYWSGACPFVSAANVVWLELEGDVDEDGWIIGTLSFDLNGRVGTSSWEGTIEDGTVEGALSGSYPYLSDMLVAYTGELNGSL